MKNNFKHLSRIVLAVVIMALLVSVSFTMIATAQTPTPTPTPTATPSATPSPTGSPTLGQPINPNWTPPAPAATSPPVQTTPEVVVDVIPAVVAINVSVTSVDFFNQPITQQGAGSGWVIDPGGIIVTNNHVVEGAQTIQVALHDGSVLPATAVATDPVTDLAVVKVNATNLTAVPVGNSNNLALGQTVVAIGNSLGLGISATQGIVSALSVTINPGTEPLYGLIQTDAAINPGNSGGPLVNLSEEVVGINSAKITESGVEGMGYAINISDAMPVIQQLIQKGSVTRAYIGVALQTVTPSIASQFGLSVNKGALVVRVASGGPAAQGGLQQGDVIVNINDTDVATAADASRLIRSATVGQSLQIKYWRGSNQATATVTTIAAPTS